ncbi:MAG: hypothetical protein ACP5MG_01615 [Verrucomicrobiia bacterium]
MNTEFPDNKSENIQGSSENAQPAQPVEEAPVKKKRRWWVYLLLSLGGLFLLALILFIAAFSYYKSLVRNYTETKPRPLPTIETSKERFQEVVQRWQEFCKDLFSKRATQPFRLTAEDINQMIANFGNAKDFVRVEITNNQIVAHIMAPLTNSGKKELQGRYINADVNLKLQLEDGFLTLRVDSALANGKPVPKWIVNRVKQKNILEGLENNYEFLQVLQEMDSVEVKDGAVVFTPLKPGS